MNKLWNFIKHEILVARARVAATNDAKRNVNAVEAAVNHIAGLETNSSDRDMRQRTETINDARTRIAEFDDDRRAREEELTEHSSRANWLILLFIGIAVELWSAITTLVDLGVDWWNVLCLGAGLTIATVLASSLMARDTSDPVKAKREWGLRLIGRMAFCCVIGALIYARVLLLPEATDGDGSLLDWPMGVILAAVSAAPAFLIDMAVKRISVSSKPSADLARVRAELAKHESRRAKAIAEQRAAEEAVAQRLADRQMVRSQYAAQFAIERSFLDGQA